jgi:hypothetical protein
MAGNALGELDDGRFRRERAPATIELAADGLRLSGFAIAKADEFDDQRVAGLLAAAYGGETPPGSLAYLRGALAKQREGRTALAGTYLVLAGLKPLADPFEAAWRLSAADGLMKAGVAPATIVGALAPGGGPALERA